MHFIQKYLQQFRELFNISLNPIIDFNLTAPSNANDVTVKLHKFKFAKFSIIVIASSKIVRITLFFRNQYANIVLMGSN